jgi:hypothetical protein
MAEDIISLGHRIQLQDTTVLSTKSRYMEWMIREAILIKLHLNSMNREDVLCLSWTWKHSTTEAALAPSWLLGQHPCPFQDTDPAPTSFFCPLSHSIPTLCFV